MKRQMPILSHAIRNNQGHTQAGCCCLSYLQSHLSSCSFRPSHSPVTGQAAPGVYLAHSQLDFSGRQAARKNQNFHLDTVRIQQAIDHAWLDARSNSGRMAHTMAFLSGPLGFET